MIARARGHRHIGGPLGRGERERHYIAGIIGAVAAVIGAGVSTYGAISAGQQQQEAADYNARVARNQAAAAREAAAVAEADERAQTQRTLAATRARAAASGLDPNEGSSLLAEMETASIGELNARRIHWAGANQIGGYQSEAQLQAFQGAQYRRAGYLTGNTTLLTGAARVADIYATYSSRQSAPAPAEPPIGYVSNY
jgi:hypothetical protein